MLIELAELNRDYENTFNTKFTVFAKPRFGYDENKKLQPIKIESIPEGKVMTKRIPEYLDNLDQVITNKKLNNKG